VRARVPPASIVKSRLAPVRARAASACFGGEQTEARRGERRRRREERGEASLAPLGPAGLWLKLLTRQTLRDCLLSGRLFVCTSLAARAAFLCHRHCHFHFHNHSKRFAWRWNPLCSRDLSGRHSRAALGLEPRARAASWLAGWLAARGEQSSLGLRATDWKLGASGRPASD